MDYKNQENQLRDLLEEFEGALRSYLKTSEEFHTLVEFLAKKQSTIALYVAAQIMGPHFLTGRKRKAKKKAPPLSFELTRNDLEFLRSLKISSNI